MLGICQLFDTEPSILVLLCHTCVLHSFLLFHMPLLVTWDSFALTSKYVMLVIGCRTVYFKVPPHACINYFTRLPCFLKVVALPVDLTNLSEDHLVTLSLGQSLTSQQGSRSSEVNECLKTV